MLRSSRAVRRMHSTLATPFVDRHCGEVSGSKNVREMLHVIGVDSVGELMQQTMPDGIRYDMDGTEESEKLAVARLSALPEAATEEEALEEMKNMMAQNDTTTKSLLGQGYYGTHTPAVIRRCMIEAAGWYTPYTPYQAEVAQGRLEMLLNFQQMVIDLTGTAVSNCSLLDEATAAAEAMAMCFNVAGGGKPKKNAMGEKVPKDVFVVSNDVFEQTKDVLRTRAGPFGIKLVFVPDEELLQQVQEFGAEGRLCGVLVQSPGQYGSVCDYSAVAHEAHQHKALTVASTDLLAQVLTKPVGEYADIVVGSAQRFGVPMGAGGPHAGFLAVTDEKMLRRMPGRIIGVSKDRRGEQALRMTLQTREQHIRRDKASSNICTAQALLANVSAAYAVYHGREGLTQIASRVHQQATEVLQHCARVGLVVDTCDVFDTVHVHCDSAAAVQAFLDRGFYVRGTERGVALSFDETVTAEDVATIKSVLETLGSGEPTSQVAGALSADLRRTTDFLTHPVFKQHRSETRMMRYLRSLEDKDLGLDRAMIPLGSCTMKLNAAAEMTPLTWESVGKVHPFVPPEARKGYAQMCEQVEEWLAAITGFDAVSLQPNSGANGEYTGMMVIKDFLRKRDGNDKRNVCLIPTSAHGTNPASAVMAGLKIVPVNCKPDNGDICVDHLRKQLEKYSDDVAAIMLTYPSTHGVFEETVREVCDLVHQHGGQVYMDGANMNAQVGMTSPGEIGADVCHLNLHKTFAIPHGGGGPGMGPIGVAKHLAPHLPSHVVAAPPSATETSITAVSAAPFGSASILTIPWMYMRMLGAAGLRHATRQAIVNANYMAARLSGAYEIAFTNANGRSAHEFIIDLRPFKATTGIVEEDVAKRLIDFGFHAPTMSWPVPGTLMVEPTESESRDELDRFCDAMLQIRAEIAAIENGEMDRERNPLKRAPHTIADLVEPWDEEAIGYTREQAVWPVPALKHKKPLWPSVSRIDNVHGDRNLACACPPMSDFTE
ncbi:MAG: hypothetical protein MHM6MM_001448 [Cercozoa sp. M6MM]